MTAIGTPAEPDELVPGPEATYDLILCRHDRIIFHDHYESPPWRLRMLVQLLTATDVVASVFDTDRANQVHDLHHSRSWQWNTAPDSVVDAIAKLCRRWGVQIYVSTTKKKTASAGVLYSVITDYGPGQSVAEHFSTREGRTRSLIERAEHFFAAPGNIPEIVLSDDHRLAALVATFLMPATLTLTEASLDAVDKAYKPSGPPPVL